jgi:hypothetical protein
MVPRVPRVQLLQQQGSSQERNGANAAGQLTPTSYVCPYCYLRRRPPTARKRTYVPWYVHVRSCVPVVVHVRTRSTCQACTYAHTPTQFQSTYACTGVHVRSYQSMFVRTCSTCSTCTVHVFCTYVPWYVRTILVCHNFLPLGVASYRG